MPLDGGMSTITRETVRTIQSELQAAIVEVLERHNMTARGGLNVRFSDTHIRFTGEADVADKAAIADEKRAEFERWCTLYGVTAEAYGVEFNYAQRRFRLDGLMSGRATVNVFAATDVRTGKQYKLPRAAAAAINAAVAAKTPAMAG